MSSALSSSPIEVTFGPPCAWLTSDGINAAAPRATRTAAPRAKNAAARRERPGGRSACGLASPRNGPTPAQVPTVSTGEPLGERTGDFLNVNVASLAAELGQALERLDSHIFHRMMSYARRTVFTSLVPLPRVR